MRISNITPECINEVMSCRVSTTPVAGMLGTMYVGSDRYTVVCMSASSRTKCRVIMHFPDEFLANRFTKDGIEYIPEADLNALIERVTPNLSWFDRYANMTDAEKAEELEWSLTRFEKESSYSLRKNGRWMPKGSGAWGTSSIHWGYGDEYRDPSF